MTQIQPIRPHGRTLTPCQGDCVSQVEANLDFLEELGAHYDQMTNQGVRAFGLTFVDTKINQSIADFNDCMNAC